MTYGTATYRLEKIKGFLSCAEFHLSLAPDKTSADELDVIAIRLENMAKAARQAASYSRECVDRKYEADLRVDAMIDAARARREAA